MPNQDEASD